MTQKLKNQNMLIVAAMGVGFKQFVLPEMLSPDDLIITKIAMFHFYKNDTRIKCDVINPESLHKIVGPKKYRKIFVDVHRLRSETRRFEKIKALCSGRQIIVLCEPDLNSIVTATTWLAQEDRDFMFDQFTHETMYARGYRG